MPEDGISFFAAMTLPDFHNVPTDALYRTFYCDFCKKQHCEVLRRINKTNVVNEASYDEPTRKSRIAMLHSGRVQRYTLLETDEGRGVWVKAHGRVQEMELNIDGPGPLKTAGLRLERQSERVVADGPGRSAQERLKTMARGPRRRQHHQHTGRVATMNRTHCILVGALACLANSAFASLTWNA